MHKINYKLLVVFLLIVLQSSLFGATYYVATTGNNTNDGSIEKPWLTPDYGAAQLVAGDTLYIRGGTYTPTSRVRISKLSGGGTAENRIVVSGYLDEEVWIDGTNMPWTGVPARVEWEGIIELYGAYITVEKIKVKNSKHFGIFIYNNYAIVRNCYTDWTASSGIYSVRSHGLIEYNEIDRPTYAGSQEALTIYMGDYNTIRYNYLHDSANATGHVNGLGIDLKDGCHDIDVYGNHIVGMLSHGIYVDSRGDTYNINIFNNLIHSFVRGNGIQIATEAYYEGAVVNNVKIYNNIVYDVGHGIRVGYSSRDYNYYTNMNIVNNTIYDVKGNGIMLYTDDNDLGTSSDIIVANNAIKKTATVLDPNYYHDISFEAGHAPGVTVINNAIERVSGQHGTDYILGDPMWKDEVAGDFHLQAGSSLINAGTSSYFIPTQDHDKNIRSKSSGVDIGAFSSPKGTHFVIARDKLIQSTN